MKSLVSTMFICLVKLGSLGLLGILFLIFFGIFGNQLFQGATHGKCMIGGVYIDGVEVSAGNVTAKGSFAFEGDVYWTKVWVLCLYFRIGPVDLVSNWSCISSFLLVPLDLVSCWSCISSFLLVPLDLVSCWSCRSSFLLVFYI